MRLPRPQSVILPDPGENALLLVLKLSDRKRHARAVADAAAQVPALTQRLAASAASSWEAAQSRHALLDYTQPVSGAHFFAPSLSTLRSL